MQKNVKRQGSTTSTHASARGPIEQPEAVNMDVLATMLEEELVNRFMLMQETHERAAARGYNTLRWEVEMAYVKRELQIRRHRREEHDRWSKACEREFMAQEYAAPHADLDNSGFLKSIGMYA